MASLATTTTPRRRQKVGVDIRVVRSQGPRDYMEDRHCVKAICSGKIIFIGVFDGHGGYEVAEMCAKEAPVIFEDIVKHNPDMSESLRILYRALDLRALHLNKSATGCTAAIAVITQDRIWCSNCGDAMIAIKKRDGTTKYMSEDHKVENEKERIQKSGGIVTYLGGCARVYGTLNIARSIGDHFIKAFVISDPYVTATTCPKSDIEWITVASDGVWDVYNPEDYAKDLREVAGNLTQMIDNCYMRGSQDNITIAHCDFKLSPSS